MENLAADTVDQVYGFYNQMSKDISSEWTKRNKKQCF